MSGHGKWRVATDKALFAMPEVAIGLFPDVGGGYLLPRLPQTGLGAALALTGLRLKGAEVAAAGLATHFVPEAKVDEVLTTLSQVAPSERAEEELQAILDEASDVGAVEEARERGSPLLRETDVVARVFGSLTEGMSTRDLLDRLEAEAASGSEAATLSAKAIAGASPTSVAVVLEQMRRGATMSLPDVLAMEFRMAQEFMANPDFYEGVRAALVDKDRSPAWQPAPTADQVAAYFAHDTPGRQEMDPLAELRALATSAPAL
jgi:enoyl-CoA hydratase/carnithine racemase